MLYTVNTHVKKKKDKRGWRLLHIIFREKSLIWNLLSEYKSSQTRKYTFYTKKVYIYLSNKLQWNNQVSRNGTYHE